MAARNYERLVKDIPGDDPYKVAERDFPLPLFYIEARLLPGEQGQGVIEVYNSRSFEVVTLRRERRVTLRGEGAHPLRYVTLLYERPGYPAPSLDPMFRQGRSDFAAFALRSAYISGLSNGGRLMRYPGTYGRSTERVINVKDFERRDVVDSVYDIDRIAGNQADLRKIIGGMALVMGLEKPADVRALANAAQNFQRR